MSVSWLNSSPTVLRAHHAADAFALEGPPAPGVVATSVAPSGNFRGGVLFTPPGARQETVIVYFHGGGFVAGSPTSHRCVTSWLAAESGMPVLSAAYRLAPEHPFPAQAEDSIAAIEHAGRGAAQLLLAGDSAGASVALWGWNGSSDVQRQSIRGAALLYGAYGVTESDSIARWGTPESGLDLATLVAMYRRLGNFPTLLLDPAFNPLDRSNTYRLPLYILGAGQDALLDDSRRLFAMARSQGAATKFVEAKGAEHGFLKPTGADPVANEHIREVGAWLRSLAG